MEIQLACLADAANLSQEKKLNVLGEFDVIWAEKVPVRWPILFFVAKFKASVGEGDTFSFVVRVLDDDGQLISTPMEFTTVATRQPDPGLQHSGAIIVGIRDATFKDYGTYSFDLVGNGSLLCSVPLHVRPRVGTPQA